MQTCDDKLLSAYLDDELDAFTRQRIAEHVRVCARCADEIESLRGIADAAAAWAPRDVTPLELARLHETIDRSVEAPATLRIGGGLGLIGLIAASILVISGTWLATLPAQPRPGRFRTAARPQAWEEVATNLQVQLPPLGSDDGLDQRIRFADAGFTNWMIDSLDGVPR